MGLEIELKVHVKHPQPIELILHRRAHFLGYYHKKDRYFSLSSTNSSSLFRIREEKEDILVTKKIKHINQGIEKNVELEFRVGELEVFLRFLNELGFCEQYRKEKQGQAWQFGQVKVELGTVSHLGHYAELEIILKEEASQQEQQEAQNQLLAVLQELGLPFSDIEERTYAQLLGQSP